MAAPHAELIDLQRTNKSKKKVRCLRRKIYCLGMFLISKIQLCPWLKMKTAKLSKRVVPLRNLNVAYESLVTKKVLEEKVLSKHLRSNLGRLNSDLNKELGVLRR